MYLTVIEQASNCSADSWAGGLVGAAGLLGVCWVIVTAIKGGK